MEAARVEGQQCIGRFGLAVAFGNSFCHLHTFVVD
jgi:hypothetical protein